MVTYAVNTDGLPIYDATGRNLVEIGGRIFDIDGHRIHHFGARGKPMTGGPTDLAGLADIPQPILIDRIRFLMAMSGARPFAPGGGAIRIAMTPARASRDPIDYTTKTGSSLYDRATKSLFVDNKDAYDLKSNGLMNVLDAIGNTLDSLPESTQNDYLGDLCIAKTWELQANVASTQPHISSAWRRWQFFCKEINVQTDLAGHPDPMQALQVYVVQLRQRRYDKGSTLPI